MKIKAAAAVMAASSLLICAAASAHVSTASGPATGDGATATEVTLQIGHGCEESNGTKHDTLSLKVDIPAGVKGLRAVSSPDFPVLKIDGSGDNITAVTWSKAATDPGLDTDSNFYKLTFRATMPDAAFTKLYFPSHQSCKGGFTTEWTKTPTNAAGSDAASVPLLPKRTSGWNKLPVKNAVAKADLPVFFKDAAIVWKGTSAYSANAVTAEQLGKEAGVTALESLAAGDEIYVKW